MNSGDLDREITFQERGGIQDAATGAWVYAWNDIATDPTVWAKVIDETRPEKVEDGISMSSRPAVFFIRWRDDITGEMRLDYEGRLMRIVAGPAEVGRREWLKFTAIQFSTEGQEP